MQHQEINLLDPSFEPTDEQLSMLMHSMVVDARAKAQRVEQELHRNLLTQILATQTRWGLAQMQAHAAEAPIRH